MMMLFAQIAQAAEPSHLVLDGAMIGLIVTNLGLIGKAVADALGKRKVKQEEKKKVELCDAHEARLNAFERLTIPGRLAALETNNENLLRSVETSRKENREDHQQIFNELRRLREAK